MHILTITTDIIQATTAIISGILAGITLWLAVKSKDQAKQIEELSVIAKQLAATNEIQWESLQLEMVSTMKQRMPIFVIRKTNPVSSDGLIQIEIQNVGLPHQEINTLNSTPNISEFKNWDTEAGAKHNPMINVHMHEGNILDNYEFDIISTSEHGIQYVQRLKKHQGIRARLLPPKLYAQVEM